MAAPDTSVPDKWQAGASYESYIGRWSRLVAPEFLDWLALGEAPRRWLDVGRGTGALSEEIRHRHPNASLVGLDSSAGFVGSVPGSPPETAVLVGDGMALPFAPASFGAVVSGLVLNFMPDASRAVAEQVRVVTPGGVVAAYVWDYAGEMQLLQRFWDAAASLDPRAAELDEAKRFPVCHPEPLLALFEGAGLEQVQVTSIDVPTRFTDFDDLWSPFLGGQGPAPGYVATLTGERRQALRERLRASLEVGEDDGDGAIDLVARAWAVRGRR